MIVRRNIPRILIADDHTLVAEACKKLFSKLITRSSPRLATAAPLSGPLWNCALISLSVDISMPLLNGLDAGQQIKELVPSVKLVYVTMNHDADVAAEAFRRGAFRVPAEDMCGFGTGHRSARGAARQVLSFPDDCQRYGRFSATPD